MGRFFRPDPGVEASDREHSAFVGVDGESGFVIDETSQEVDIRFVGGVLGFVVVDEISVLNTRLAGGVDGESGFVDET